MFTHDEGRRIIAIGHLSDSRNLKNVNMLTHDAWQQMKT